MKKLALNKIFICAKSQLYRETLAKAILAESSNYDIAGTHSDITKISSYLTKFDADYVLVDLDRTTTCPFDFVQNICERFPNTKLIVLTFWDCITYNEKLLNSGASFCYITGQKLEVLIQYLDKGITDKKDLPRKLSKVG